MTVGELIARLAEFDKQATVKFHTSNGWDLTLLSIYPDLSDNSIKENECNLDIGRDGE